MEALASKLNEEIEFAKIIIINSENHLER